MSAVKKITQLQMPWSTEDPFIFCAFHNDHYPKGNGKLGPDASLSGRFLGQDFNQKDGWAMYHGQHVPGFPAHPHVGFETITVAQEGFVDHSDSLGAAGRFGQGDVQWMTAGKGVQHSEMFPLINTEEENPLLLFQIWLNLPKHSKNVEPYFAMMWQENIPVIEEKNDNGINTRVTLIAGTYKTKSALNPAPDSWAALPENDVAIWIIDIDAEGTFTLPKTKEGTRRSLYYFEGESLNIEGFEIPPMHRIEINEELELKIKNGFKPSRLLLLQGQPIRERVVKNGPFVATSSQEIEEAIERFKKDEFGGWPWESSEQVHTNAKGRFAKYPNGKIEKP